MKLAYPDALWGLWLIPILAIVLALDGQRRRRILERIGHLAQIRRMTESVSLGRRRLKSVALVLGIAAAVMSLARPQRAGVAHVLPRRGLDIVVALDFSKSMLAADVYPTRLARAKYELARLIDGLKGDRVGLVAFAGVTLSYPLTSDYAAAKLFWRDLGPDDIPVGGTNLGDAIKAALELLQYGHPQQNVGDERPPARILILLTDGADTEGAALAAAREAKKLGVKVFTVGIGSREGEVVVLKRKDDGTAEYITDPLGAPIRMALDETTLREIAKLTDGKYFQVDPERFGVDMVQSAIATEERQEEGHRFVVEPAEAYVWFLAPAFALLALEAFASDRKRRKRKTAATEKAEEAEEAIAADAELQKKRGPGVKRRRRPGAMAASFLLFFMLPMLGGWTGFKRLSPAVKEGNERLAAGKADEALLAYDRALAEQPEDLSLHFNRGGALYSLGKFPEAQREFLRATEAADPSLKADAYYNMGNALLRQTLPKESIEAYKQALRLRPDDRRAKWNLELALKLLEKQDEEKQKQSKDDQKNDQKNDDKKDQKNDDKKDQDKQDQKQNDQKNDKQDSKDQKQAGNDQQKPPPEGDKKQDDKKQDDKKQDDKKQAENDKKQDDKKQDDKKSGSPEEKKEQQKQDEKKQDEKQAENDKKPEGDAKDGQPKQAQAGTGKARDIDKQDAEAVLDAFERVEPTVQKDLARRKAKNRRPRKDW